MGRSFTTEGVIVLLKSFKDSIIDVVLVSYMLENIFLLHQLDDSKVIEKKIFSLKFYGLLHYHIAVCVALDKSEIKLYFSLFKCLSSPSPLYWMSVISLLILEVQWLSTIYFGLDLSVYFFFLGQDLKIPTFILGKFFYLVFEHFLKIYCFPCSLLSEYQ